MTGTPVSLTKRMLTSLLSLLFSIFSVVPVVHAMCPLCVAGAATGLGIARYYGVDDSVVGVWIGALAVSSALWINRVVNSRYRGRHIPFQGFVVGGAVAAAMLVPFYFAGFFNGMPYMSDTILGVNRVLFGTIIGGAIMYVGAPISNHIKKARHAAFPYQSMIITLSLLALLSLLLWYLTSNFSLA